jgi:predicted SnoaL-like aldol condensation-catalyzing enzyme
MSRFRLVAGAVLVLAFAMPLIGQRPDPAASLEANKKLVLDWYAFQGSREDRARRFLADDYIQHNPRFLKMDEITGARGRDAWLAANDAARGRASLVPHGIPLRNPVLITAEGDLVTVVFKAALPDPDNEAKTYDAFAITVFRIKDGRLAEHWDSVTLAKGWMDGLKAR